MQIILRGKKVRTTVITKSLSKTEVDTYRPTVRESNPLSPGNVSFEHTLLHISVVRESVKEKKRIVKTGSLI